MPDVDTTGTPAGPVLTPLQARTAQAIVNVFETGTVPGRYDQLTRLPGDPGGLSYGRSQCTLRSGNLHALLERYCADPAARFRAQLAVWLPALARRETALDTDPALHELLRTCAADPAMCDAQDAFFDTACWQPALRAATRIGLRTPLAVAVVYDGHVHGSWRRIRDRASFTGLPAVVGEQAWVKTYVRERRAWLAGHRIRILRATVYRMDAFLELIEQGKWGLELPLRVRGVEISVATLDGLAGRVQSGSSADAVPFASLLAGRG